MTEVLKEIEELSLVNEKSVEQICMKLAEETGEVNQAALSYLKASGSNYKSLGSEDVKEECADVLMVALSLFYKVGGTNEELSDLLEFKTTKWKSVK